MAHLMAPHPSKATLPVFFNVDGVVGAAPAANKREDVLLVQFFFTLIAAQPLSVGGTEFYAAVKAVKMTGSIDPVTIAAIRAMQSEVKKHQQGTIVDGRISPAHGYGYGGGGLFAITHLNESVQHRHVDNWPRIDRIGGCPAELKQMVVRAVQGT